MTKHTGKGHYVKKKAENKAQKIEDHQKETEETEMNTTETNKNAKTTEETVKQAPKNTAKTTKASDIDIEIDDADEAVSEVSPPDDENEGGRTHEAEAELADQRNKYLRLAAEYENFRKRSKLERETTYRDARSDAISRFLPVYDNLERALQMECPDDAFHKGIEMTMTGLIDILESLDVKPIEALGQPFDPNRHNAVMSIEDPELGEKIVAQEYQKGFVLGDKVIRFSTVVVAN